MKRTFHLSLIMFVFLMVACSSPKERVIEMPQMTAANATNLDIRSVVLTDSVTILKCHVNFRPNYWICISPESRIIADGKEYPMISCEGLTPDERFFLPESGEHDFTMTFNAVPLSTKSIDFTEGDDGWKIWGIDVSGDENKADYPASLPKDIIKKEMAKDLDLSPVLKASETNLTFHVLDYRKDFGNSLDVMMAGFPDYTTYSLKLDENGTAKLSTTLFGTTTLYCGLTDLSNYVTSTLSIIPGENIDIYIDPRFSTFSQMKNRDVNYSLPVSIYDNGTLAAFNQNRHLIKDYDYVLFDESEPFMSWKVTPDQFTDQLLQKRMEIVDSIKSSSLPENLKEYALANLDASTLSVILNARGILYNLCYIAHQGKEVNPADSITVLPGEEHFARVAAATDPSNPLIPALGNSAAIYHHDWSKYTGKSDANETYRFVSMFDKAAKGKLSDDNIEEAKKMSSSYYAEALSKRNEMAIKQLEESKKLITPNPDVPADKLFEAIVAPYKGKVVLVDLWNTWCGPCRAALKANEPLKSGELADKDIVWLYIADESSDMGKYIDMIPNIKGVHHILDSEQISKIRDQFNVDGIPFYILVDRNGKAEGHPDFRDHSKLVDGIKSKL